LAGGPQLPQSPLQQELGQHALGRALGRALEQLLANPKFSIDQSKAVAEASVATIEDELRRQAVVAIVSRQMAASPTPAGDTAAANPEKVQ
jgi:hypothetical protein